MNFDLFCTQACISGSNILDILISQLQVLKEHKLVPFRIPELGAIKKESSREFSFSLSVLCLQSKAQTLDKTDRTEQSGCRSDK